MLDCPAFFHVKNVGTQNFFIIKLMLIVSAVCAILGGGVVGSV